MLSQSLARRTPTHVRALSSLSGSSNSSSINNNNDYGSFLIAFFGLGFVTASTVLLPSHVTLADAEPPAVNTKEEISLEEISKNDNKSHGTPCFTHFNGKVYNLTSFIESHPGGKEKIKLACGTKEGVKVWWEIYRQHFDAKVRKKWLV